MVQIGRPGLSQSDAWTMLEKSLHIDGQNGPLDQGFGAWFRQLTGLETQYFTSPTLPTARITDTTIHFEPAVDLSTDVYGRGAIKQVWDSITGTDPRPGSWGGLVDADGKPAWTKIAIVALVASLGVYGLKTLKVL